MKLPACRDDVKYLPDKRAHFYLLSGVSCVHLALRAAFGGCAPKRLVAARCAGLHSTSAENCMTENARSLCSVKVAIPPCAAKAAIPCELAVRKRFIKTNRR